MKLGILAYSTKTGLGYQTKAYCDWLKPEKVLLADLSQLNGMEQNDDWYKENNVIKSMGIPDQYAIGEFLDGLSVVLMAETPLNYLLITMARAKGVKTIIHYNYEFLGWHRNRNLPPPDLLLAPTSWNIQNVISMNIAKVSQLGLPISKKEFKERTITELKTIGHVAGRIATNDRNGTVNFLEMAKLLGNEYRYKIYVQTPKERLAEDVYNEIMREVKRAQRSLKTLEIITDIEDNRKIYEEIDLMVMPRRYGGLCIPVLEALAVGIPVIMPNISPNGDWLPNNWLVGSQDTGQVVTVAKIQVYDADNRQLANKVLEIGQEIKMANIQAREIGAKHSWEKMLNQYKELLKQVCE